MSPVAAGLSLIVARARNGMIGRGNALLWHIPEELQHFRAATMGHTLIMGRRTWQSIGRPLPGRRTIVVSRDANLVCAGCERAGTLSQAIALARKTTGDDGPRDTFVVGGAQIYRQALPYSNRILITHVELDPVGDVAFPWPLARPWERVSGQSHRSSRGVGFCVEEWRRARPGRILPA